MNSRQVLKPQGAQTVCPGIAIGFGKRSGNRGHDGCGIRAGGQENIRLVVPGRPHLTVVPPHKLGHGPGRREKIERKMAGDRPIGDHRAHADIEPVVDPEDAAQAIRRSKISPGGTFSHDDGTNIDEACFGAAGKEPSPEYPEKIGVGGVETVLPQSVVPGPEIQPGIGRRDSLDGRRGLDPGNRAFQPAAEGIGRPGEFRPCHAEDPVRVKVKPAVRHFESGVGRGVESSGQTDRQSPDLDDRKEPLAPDPAQAESPGRRGQSFKQHGLSALQHFTAGPTNDQTSPTEKTLPQETGAGFFLGPPQMNPEGGAAALASPFRKSPSIIKRRTPSFVEDRCELASSETV